MLIKQTEANKNKKGNSLFHRISAWLHLWLGLASGLIVVIVSLTGCIYVFQDEIRTLYEPWRYVESSSKPFLQPTTLINKAARYLPKKKATSITYGSKKDAAVVAAFNRKKGIFVSVYVNPYNGNILKVTKLDRKHSADFFRVILNGHRALWLPYNIGRPIVGVGILMFVVLLISGIVLWWPKKWIKSIIDKSFKIKWNASFKRVNYDTHNVLGFYACLVLLMISLTGLVWSFQWVSKSMYWITSGGRSLKEFSRLTSDTSRSLIYSPQSVDQIWHQHSHKLETKGMFIGLPTKKADVITATVYLREGTFYKANSYTYDQYTLKAVKSDSPFSGEYDKATIADKLRRMNYDLHVGAIWGIPGKILVFIASLISASLPVTGLLIWLGKKKKKQVKTVSNKPANKPQRAPVRVALQVNASGIE
jgi:uncharacterized iron-regulated membrane protein